MNGIIAALAGLNVLIENHTKRAGILCHKKST